MTFELTDGLIQQILFSMEDQTCCHAVDAEALKVTEIKTGAEFSLNEERFYPVPEWTSADGFALLEKFTENLHAPLAREELKMAIEGGRGVFRNFKNVLKAYPDVERKFHFYKNGAMKARIMDWYNSLRESWGLEKLAQTESDSEEEMDELVSADFIFREYDSKRDWNDVQRSASFLADEYGRMLGGELGTAFFEMDFLLSSSFESGEKLGFVCQDQSEEFTGCALVSRLKSHAGKTMDLNTVVLTDFFVLQEYRGLGIGSRLIQECLSSLKKKGIHFVLISNIFIPEAMGNLLVQNGFERMGSGYKADLSEIE